MVRKGTEAKKEDTIQSIENLLAVVDEEEFNLRMESEQDVKKGDRRRRSMIFSDRHSGRSSRTFSKYYSRATDVKSSTQSRADIAGCSYHKIETQIGIATAVTTAP